MKHDGIVFQGPFGLKQGGKGIPVRNPVYIARNGKKEFWGFTIAIIRVPDIFSNSMKALENFGYQCRLLKTTAPWSRKYVDVYHSGENLTQPVSNQFTIAGDTWKLQVMPEKGWGGNKRMLLFLLCGGSIVLLLLIGLTVAVMVLEERRKHLRVLTEMDSLTRIYNRNGFDRKIDQLIADRADLQKHFPKNAVIARNGGDEFCLLLPNQTCESIHDKFKEFTRSEKKFYHKGEVHSFTISLGYAQYPQQAKNYDGLMHCADPDDDELLFANYEMLHLCGCKDMDEFFAYTKQKFCNLINKQEQTEVEESIWKQINANGGQENDYVKFSLVRKDGTQVTVFDHGRIVENIYYGRVFYVLLLNEK